MQQPRILTRGEALLREPSSGSSNLAANANQWHSLTPRYEDERFEVSAVSLVLAGNGLLSRLDTFAGSPATLEIGVLGQDGYGSLRDLASLGPQVLNSAQDWNAGTHSHTFADAEAGQARDGSRRVGLRGTPVRALTPPPQPARWLSSGLDLRYGGSLAAVSWDCWTLRNPAGQTVAPPKIELRLGTRSAAGLIAWSPYRTIASTAAEIDGGFADLTVPAPGGLFQLRVTLPYADPAAAVTPSDSLLYTATFFAFCVWVNLRYSRWTFSSLAEVIERAELVRHLSSASWAGGEDVALLRIPLNFLLRGRYRETIRARISSGSGLSLLEVVPQADLRFETAPR